MLRPRSLSKLRSRSRCEYRLPYWRRSCPSLPAPTWGLSRRLAPVQWLAGFAKIELEPGEERRVVLSLDETAFRKWDASLRRWCVYPGRYEVRVASSSRDIRLTASIAVGDGQWAFNPEQARTSPQHRRGTAHVRSGSYVRPRRFPRYIVIRPPATSHSRNPPRRLRNCMPARSPSVRPSCRSPSIRP